MRTLAALLVQTMVANSHDGHGDSGIRFNLTFSAGPSAAPLGPADVLCWSGRAPAAAAGAVAGAAGAAVLPSAASAVAAEDGPGGA